jgi:hypothetical protein
MREKGEKIAYAAERLQFQGCRTHSKIRTLRRALVRVNCRRAGLCLVLA